MYGRYSCAITQNITAWYGIKKSLNSRWQCVNCGGRFWSDGTCSEGDWSADFFESYWRLQGFVDVTLNRQRVRLVAFPLVQQVTRYACQLPAAGRNRCPVLAQSLDHKVFFFKWQDPRKICSSWHVHRIAHRLQGRLQLHELSELITGGPPYGTVLAARKNNPSVWPWRSNGYVWLPVVYLDHRPAMCHCEKIDGAV